MKDPLIAIGVFLIMAGAAPWVLRLFGLYDDYFSWVLGK